MIEPRRLCTFWLGLPLGFVIGMFAILWLASRVPWAVRDSYEAGIQHALQNKAHYRLVLNEQGQIINILYQRDSIPGPVLQMGDRESAAITVQWKEIVPHYLK